MMTLHQIRAENMRRTLAAGVPVSTGPMPSAPEGSAKRASRALKYALRGTARGRVLRGTLPRRFRNRFPVSP